MRCECQCGCIRQDTKLPTDFDQSAKKYYCDRCAAGYHRPQGKK